MANQPAPIIASSCNIDRAPSRRVRPAGATPAVLAARSCSSRLPWHVPARDPPVPVPAHTRRRRGSRGSRGPSLRSLMARTARGRAAPTKGVVQGACSRMTRESSNIAPGRGRWAVSPPAIFLACRPAHANGAIDGEPQRLRAPGARQSPSAMRAPVVSGRASRRRSGGGIRREPRRSRDVGRCGSSCRANGPLEQVTVRATPYRRTDPA